MYNKHVPMLENNFEKEPRAVGELRKIFDENKEKRISVVGASCSGKSTLMRYFPEAVDMDDLLFGTDDGKTQPLLSPEERKFVSGTWAPEVGEFMAKRAKELIQIEAGHPVFGTVVFPSDLVIEITVPEEALQERIKNRSASLENVLSMKTQIEANIESSGIPRIVVENA